MALNSGLKFDGNLTRAFKNDMRKFATLVLIAGYRAGLAGWNLSYPENPALKPRKPS